MTSEHIARALAIANAGACIPAVGPAQPVPLEARTLLRELALALREERRHHTDMMSTLGSEIRELAEERDHYRDADDT